MVSLGASSILGKITPRSGLHTIVRLLKKINASLAPLESLLAGLMSRNSTTMQAILSVWRVILDGVSEFRNSVV